MTMKNIFLLFATTFALLFTACQNEKGTTISGTVKGAGGFSGMLEENAFAKSTAIDKITFDASGAFKVTVKDGLKAGIYRITAGRQFINLILNGTEKNVVIDADLAQLGNLTYKITGSPLSEQFRAAASDFLANKIDLKGIKDIADKTDNALLAMALVIPAEAQTNKPENMDFAYHQRLYARVLKAAPASPYTAFYDEYLNAAQMAAAKVTIKTGIPAPDIQLADPNGKKIALSSLKGKVVLLDFWASWCGPCRKANPSVVAAYNRYKDKGFTVYSVSLDEDKGKWLDAIQKDGLTWENHVSDLKGWKSSAAQLYDVHGIPHQILIDKKGNIVQILESMGHDLETPLKALLP
jgi:thiol-disulfide isomerase/thioredoxin